MYNATYTFACFSVHKCGKWNEIFFKTTLYAIDMTHIFTL